MKQQQISTKKFAQGVILTLIHRKRLRRRAENLSRGPDFCAKRAEYFSKPGPSWKKVGPCLSVCEYKTLARPQLQVFRQVVIAARKDVANTGGAANDLCIAFHLHRGRL